MREDLNFRRALRELRRNGLLLLSDPRIPSVAGIVTGRPVRGSWWAHPQARQIFRVASGLAERKDVLVLKLVAGKQTFVLRRHWPALLAIGSARERWQMRGLSAGAKRLLAKVLKSRRVPLARMTVAAREMEARLLVLTEEVHTETGAHAKVLRSWEDWAAARNVRKTDLGPSVARRSLARAVRKLAGIFAEEALLPWPDPLILAPP